MARQFFGVEKGLDIFQENGDIQVRILSGSAVPDGLLDQSSAPIGSLYLRNTTGELYQKIANAGNSADWELNGSSSAGLGNWRPERVDAHTGQVLSAGVTDPTGWSDNDGGFDGTDATVGHYVLDGNCDLFEITVVGGASSITLAAAASAPVADDMFAVKFNLPDPAGQENQAIIVYDGAACIKVADVDFANASGITVDAGYTAGTGDPVAGDSVLEALQKIDGNVDELTSAVGVAQGDNDMGTYTGSLLNDNESAKQNIQQLETEAEALRSSIGGSAGDTDMGTYTGEILTDNTDQRTINQELEDAIETGGVTKEETGVSTPTVLDAVLVDEARSCVWLVSAFDESNLDDVQSVMIHGLNDGTASADASSVTDDVFSKERLNSNFNFQVSVVLNGAGAAQEMRLQVDTSETGLTYTAVRLGCSPSGY